MLNETYPFALPPLPYAYNALEPAIDEETMHYHHDKHFKAYIDNLNKALEKYPTLQRLTLTQLLYNPQKLPGDVQESILQNGGGVYNHFLFFDSLAPQNAGGHMPSGVLMGLIDSTFGSYEAFKTRFSQTALGVFGSGWAVLALNRNRRLEIATLANQQTLVRSGARPLLLFDVWEHAYYLKYRNVRADYIDNLWSVITFGEV